MAANYQKQIDNLDEQLKRVEELKNGKEKLQHDKLALLNEQILNYKALVEKKPAVN